ncbi:MAG: right-handed parallel beta-helix repeat-containing protein [Terracidiphilus sp.]|jgi:hypothetical protein
MRVCFRLFLLCALATETCAFGQSIHYLDCKDGSDAADSLTPQTAWRTVAKANSYIYQPGDALLLRRDARCDGMLWPKGSGTEQAPIHLGAYGQGALPIIVGGSESAGLRLSDQQYWEIENLEVVGGSPYGIHIGGSAPAMRHFRITNVVVHDVPGTPLTKDSGLVVITPDNRAKSRIDDVVVDGVTAYRTSEWAGIIVNGAGFDADGADDHGEHIVVRNSMVHDVAGDGILLARVSDGVLEHNVAWNTGMQETQTIGTPNAIWEWRCRDCRVQYNEGYFTDSPGVDGGVFDIDYGDENNLLQHNFGHDSQGYCVSAFGADGPGGNSIHSEIRENTCIHNGRSPRLSERQGAIFLYTWNGGKLDGVEIVDNTVIWDPPVRVPAFQSTAEFTGNRPNRFVGNTIVAVSRSFVSSESGMQFSGNRYCAPKRTLPQQPFQEESSLNSAASPAADSSSLVEADPAANKPDELCGCLEQLLRKTAGTGARPSAPEPAIEQAASKTAPGGVHPLAGSWVLGAVLAPPPDPQADQSRGQLVLIESMMHQFADLGLVSIAVPTRSMTRDELQQWRTDWNFEPGVEIDAANASGLRKADNPNTATLRLISPSGQVAASWQYPVSPADVWLQIQSHLGTPAGTQQMPACQSPGIR